MTVWITGASSGIGKSLTLKLLSEGFDVIASSRRKSDLEKLTELVNFKSGLRIVPMDLSDYETTLKTAEDIAAEFRVDCLINNAGITSFKPVLEDTIGEIRDIMNVNLLSPVILIKSLLPKMIQNNYGKIVNILSVAADKIFTGSSAYSASKKGLLAYTDVLREELRPRNIRIINLLPGATNTPIWPEKMRDMHKNHMMNTGDLADFIYGILINESNIVPEKIILRPLGGDL